MSSRVIFDGPINNLSLGNVSYNFLRELIKKNAVDGIFPVQDRADFSAFDSPQEIKNQIIPLIHNRYRAFDRQTPTLRVWHINGAERKLTDKQYLYTFYECDEPTFEEITIVTNQEHTFFSSSESCSHFQRAGLTNVSYIPIGFDPDLHKTNKKYLPDGVIHFGLIGKFEYRKNTRKIIQTWLKRFGNDSRYQLTCLVNNPFFEGQMMNQILVQTLEGKNYSNINFLPHQEKNSSMNEVYNSIDIDLSGLSGSEGWGLPSFNSACLGNVCVVSNCSAHKDWAKGENIVLVEPNVKVPAYDNYFFRENQPFNQGMFWNIEEEAMLDGIERALVKLQENPEKKERKDLQEEFSYEKTIDRVLSVIYA